jgi:hypothetical protein
MLSSVGIGTGAAFTFSVVGLFFPEIFPDNFKAESGTVLLYFEATAVILTLVLLGQLLEAKAHSQTSSALKALLQLAPTTAIGSPEIIDSSKLLSPLVITPSTAIFSPGLTLNKSSFLILSIAITTSTLFLSNRQGNCGQY